MWKTFLVVLGLCATCYADIAVVFNPSPLPALIDTNGLGGGTATVVDTNALRAASIICTNISYAGLTNALAQVPSGGELYLPAGNYVCTSNTISIPNSNITIRGAGWATILNAFAGQTNHLLLIENCNVTIRDLQMIGNKNGGTAYSMIVGTLASGTNIVIENVWINGSDDYGIANGNSAAQMSVQSCKIEKYDSYGVYVHGFVDNCYLSGNTHNISLIGTAGHATGNRIYGGGEGIVAGTRYVVNGNYISLTTDDGVYVNGTECVVSDNVLAENTGWGIYAFAGGLFTISGNRIYSSGDTKADIVIGTVGYGTVAGNRSEE